MARTHPADHGAHEGGRRPRRTRGREPLGVGLVGDHHFTTRSSGPVSGRSARDACLGTRDATVGIRVRPRHAPPLPMPPDPVSAPGSAGRLPVGPCAPPPLQLGPATGRCRSVAVIIDVVRITLGSLVTPSPPRRGGVDGVLRSRTIPRDDLSGASSLWSAVSVYHGIPSEGRPAGGRGARASKPVRVRPAQPPEPPLTSRNPLLEGPVTSTVRTPGPNGVLALTAHRGLQSPPVGHLTLPDRRRGSLPTPIAPTGTAARGGVDGPASVSRWARPVASAPGLRPIRHTSLAERPSPAPTATEAEALHCAPFSCRRLRRPSKER